MELKESMNKVHNKVPVKLVEITLRIRGEKTEAKTSIEWGNWDKKLVGNSKKEKTDYTCKK